MAKISLLDPAGPLTGAETVPLVQGGRTLRATMGAIVAMAAAMLPATFKGDRGNPGGDASAVGLFHEIATLAVPTGVELIRTTGYAVKGIGIATYALRPAPVVAGRVKALSTAWRSQSLDGRWWELVPDPYVTFDQLGGVGKVGFEANDIQGWKNLNAYSAEMDGGAFRWRRTIYAAGDQTYRPGSTVWAYEPSPVIKMDGLTGFIHIDGQGAKIRCRGGLRYGAFNADGTATPGQTAAVFPNGSKRSTPYSGMVEMFNCSGNIVIENIELDGNLDGVVLGGGYGDTGWQIPAVGVNLIMNSGSLTIRDVYSHHHSQDGAQLQSPNLNELSPRRSVLVDNLDCAYNARQGFSLLGCKGATFTNCKFRDTGNGRFFSNPGAGFDAEAEGAQKNRDCVFINCEFVRNFGVSWIADSGDSADFSFIRCLFVGGSTWALWPRKPGLKFTDCRIVGLMVAPWSDGGVASDQSTQFLRCKFTNDPAYAPHTGSSGFMIDGGAYGTAALYQDCEFRAFGAMRLQGLAGVTTRFRDCQFFQETLTGTPIRGIFSGTNVATGAGIVLAPESLVYDRLILNGVKQAVSI